MKVKIGCCGFPKSRKQYYMEFNVVELQNTFYKLPSKEWGVKLRREAPEDFEFTMKAWQAITHPPSSPTWRKAGFKPPKELWESYGFLKPTRENFEAVEEILDFAKTIKAKIIVVQTPPRFGYSPENERSVREFFSSVSRSVLWAWEPRGSWLEKPEKLRQLVKELNIIQVSDILRHKLLYVGEIVYTRLHGLGSKWPNYSYKYTDSDLKKLVDYVNKLSESGVKEFYILFNNIYMWDDAIRFKSMLSCRTSLENNC